MTTATPSPADAPRASYPMAVIRNVACLFTAQALMSVLAICHITFGPLAGAQLAMENGWSPIWNTIPVTVMVAAAALSASPAAKLMSLVGRRAGLLLGAATCGVGGALLAVFAIKVSSFWLLLLASALIGVFQANQAQFRFAATDGAPEHLKPKAIGWVMTGGLLAAPLGAWIASSYPSALAPLPFAGAYAAAAAVAAVGSLALFGLVKPAPSATEAQETITKQDARPLSELLKPLRVRVAILCGVVGYALMSLIMTSTSTAMVFCGFSEGEAGGVISAHVFAMFGPSFFVGSLIAWIGHARVITLGLLATAACVFVAMSGIEIEQFFIALVLLGLGWNFVFIGASSLLIKDAAPHERARLEGVNDTCVFSVVAVASAASGVLNDVYGWAALNMMALPFLALAGLALLALNSARPAQES